MLYPAELSIIIDVEIKIFHVKNRFKQYLFTNPALLKVQEGKLQPKKVSCIQKTPQAIDKFTLANPKEGKHTNTITTHNTKNNSN